MSTAYRATVYAAVSSEAAIRLARVVAMRKARIVSGVTLALMTVAAIAWPAVGASSQSPLLLVAAWPVAAAAGLVTYALARARPTRASELDLAHDLYRLEVAALAAPAAGLAFALPLTAHLGVAAVFALASTAENAHALTDFGNWMVLSGFIVGHAHVAVAIHAFLTIDRMHRLRSDETPARGAWLQALGIATLCGVLPGAVLIFIPPLVVLATGFPLLPIVYGLVRSTFVAERARIANALQATVATRPAAT